MVFFNFILFRTEDPVQEVVAPKSPANADVLIPLEVQPGFTLPAGVDGNRFLLAFGNSFLHFNFNAELNNKNAFEYFAS